MQAGAAGPLRNERLPVRAVDGTVCAHVERGAVRVLGVATQAVHLVGWRSDGCLWLQQRALTKPNDPGLWDTLMGGTVSAGETVQQTLARETWEEAGLHLADLAGLRWGGQFTASRHVPDGGGAGYLLEDTHWYTVQVPDGLVPAEAAITLRADNDVAVAGETAQQVVKMIDMLEDLDDVQNVYHNAELGADAYT